MSTLPPYHLEVGPKSWFSMSKPDHLIPVQLKIAGAKLPIFTFTWPAMEKEKMDAFINNEPLVEDQDDEGFFVKLKNGVFHIKMEIDEDKYFEVNLAHESCLHALLELQRLFKSQLWHYEEEKD